MHRRLLLRQLNVIKAASTRAWPIASIGGHSRAFLHRLPSSELPCRSLHSSAPRRLARQDEEEDFEEDGEGEGGGRYDMSDTQFDAEAMEEMIQELEDKKVLNKMAKGMSDQEAEEWLQLAESEQTEDDPDTLEGDPSLSSDNMWDFYNNFDRLTHVPPFTRMKQTFELEDDLECLYDLVAGMEKAAKTPEEIQFASQAELELRQAGGSTHDQHLLDSRAQMKNEESLDQLVLYTSKFLTQHDSHMRLLRVFDVKMNTNTITKLMAALKESAVTENQIVNLERLVERLTRIIPSLDWKYRHEFGGGPRVPFEQKYADVIQASKMITDESFNGMYAILNATDTDARIAGHPVLMAAPTYTTDFPNLMTPDPILDSRDVIDFPKTADNPFHNRVVVRNHQSFFHEAALKGFEPEQFNPKAFMDDIESQVVGGTPVDVEAMLGRGQSAQTVADRSSEQAENTEAVAQEIQENSDLDQSAERDSVTDERLRQRGSGGSAAEIFDKHWQPTKTDYPTIDSSVPQTPRSYFKYCILRRGTKQQTGKGIIRHSQAFFVVGNRDGLVGIGSGKISQDEQGVQKVAVLDAMKNMDWVERFEKRTIWTELRHKFRATEIIMRPRPVGFGLRCHPTLYMVLKAAGFKDISAKVWGSRNPLQVALCAINMLHAGHNPLGMGDGFGGKGRRMWKGVGMKSKRQVELARGRRIVHHRK